MRCSFCPINADRKVQKYPVHYLLVSIWNKYRSECYRRFYRLNSEFKFNYSVLLLICNYFSHFSDSSHSLYFICSHNCFFFFNENSLYDFETYLYFFQPRLIFLKPSNC